MTSERRRRRLRALSTVLIVAGSLVMADATATVVWQEPITALITQVRQNALEDELERLQAAGPSALELEALAGLRTSTRRMAFLGRSLRRRTEAGDALGRLRMPAIGVDEVVVDGTAAGDLRQGPGFYEQQPLPGMRGTTAIAGHRTTYGAPFRRIDRLERGDRVELRMPYGRFAYRVERTRIVAPTETSVIDRVGHDRLVLSACHPLYSAAQRIVVFARLEASR